MLYFLFSCFFPLYSILYILKSCLLAVASFLYSLFTFYFLLFSIFYSLFSILYSLKSCLSLLFSNSNSHQNHSLQSLLHHPTCLSLPRRNRLHQNRIRYYQLLKNLCREHFRALIRERIKFQDK